MFLYRRKVHLGETSILHLKYLTWRTVFRTVGSNLKSFILGSL
jgi:hypothetical protein